MGLSTPAALVRAAGALLLLILIPSVAAQAPVPVTGAESAAMDIAVVCPKSFLFPKYAGQDETTCFVQDLSRDSVYLPGQTSGTSATPHIVEFSYSILSNDSQGWQVVLSRSVAYPVGGEVVPFTVNVKATPTIRTQDVRFDLHVNYTAPSGYKTNRTVPFVAEVDNYDFALLSWGNNTQIQKAGQDEVVRYELLVSNVGVFPDVYRITVRSDDDIHVTQPPNVYVPPGETRSVYIDILTPKGKLYEVGRSTAVNVKVNSVTGSGVYSGVGILQIRGSHIPTYWIPLILVGAVSAAVVTHGARERAELHRLEKGRPRRVEPTPRQAVLLAALKQRDRDAYREKQRALDAVYKERVDDYRAHRKEREAADRAEAKQAHAEFLAQKKARKAQKKADKKAARLQRKADAKAAKAQRKLDAKEAKLVKKKERELAKKRKVVEKARAKAEAKAAKAEAKAAKEAAKAAKAEAKAAKAAAKKK